MNQRRKKFLSSLAVFICVVCVCLVALSFFSPEALARVGGGQSYGGGSRGGSGGSGGGGAGFIIWIILRLILLTVEYPAIGIPLDIIIIVGIIFYVRANNNKTPSVCSADAVGTTAPVHRSYTQEFNQLRRFDPNFSEITFTDFCYALYARAQHGRGRGKLDELSPSLSEGARNSLVQRNPPHLNEVAGIIIGSMNISG